MTINQRRRRMWTWNGRSACIFQAVHCLEDAVLDRQATDSGVRHTVLHDIDIPFGSMVMLAIKWMLAYFLASIFVVGLPLLVILILWLLGMGWRLGW